MTVYVDPKDPERSVFHRFSHGIWLGLVPLLFTGIGLAFIRHGRQHGTGQMIELLQLGSGEGWSRLRAAVEQALSLGCHDVAAIRHLMLAGHLDRPTVVPIDIGSLARYERPMPVMHSYDQLLGQAVEVTA